MLENVWIKNESALLKVLNVLAKLTKMFMNIISYNISYFASELEIFDPWTALMFLIGLWAHSYLLITFQVPLVRTMSDG